MNKNLLPAWALMLASFSGISSSAFAQATTSFPYIIDLSQENEGWTKYNYNGDNETWMFFEGMGAGMSSNSKDADDAYISPAFQLEKGKQYKIATKVQLYNDPDVTYHLAITASTSTAKTDLKPIKQIGLNQQGFNVDSLIYSPSETGTYYFAFYNTTEASMTNGAIILSAFGIDEYEGKQTEVGDTIFADDFNGEDKMGQWTVADNNEDNVTWDVIEGINGITYNSDKAGAKNPANDWLFSPAINLTEGQDYLITYSVKRQGAFDPDVLEVSFGDNANTTSMTTALSVDTVNVNAETVTHTIRMSAKQTGNGFIGFHLTTPSVENGQISITSICVKAAEKTTPTKVENFKAVSSHKEKTVTLSWTNPSFDTKGVAINTPLQVKLFDGTQLIKTVDKQEAGKEGAYTFAPDNFQGYATYKAVAVIGENESDTVSTTINLDDVQGETVVLKAFDVDYSTASQWLIQGEKGAWKHDYANVFTFDYRKASKYCSEWLISPQTKMTADRRYFLSYELKTSQDYGNNIEVTIGNDQDSTTQTRVLAAYYGLQQNGFQEYTTNQFTIDTNDYYCIGFHVTNSNYYVNLRNLRICYINDGTIVDAITNLPVVNKDAKVCIYDAAGRMVSQRVNANYETVLSTLRNGFYIVRITDVNGKTSTVKIQK